MRVEQIGDCTLYLGDCLEIMRTQLSDSIDAIITDPPYGVDYQSAWRSDKNKRKPKIANDKKPFVWWLYDAYRIAKEKTALLCFCDWKVQDVFYTAIETAGYTVKSQVIWDRGWHGLGDLKGQFAPQHDIIWFAAKGAFIFQNGRPVSVQRYQRISAEKLIHPNEKPVLLMKEFVNKTTLENEIVLDPFMGSGTTGVACIQTNRKFIGIEIDEKYFDIACKRIEKEMQQIRLFSVE